MILRPFRNNSCYKAARCATAPETLRLSAWICTLTVVALLSAGAAWASPTGLLVISTADVLEPGEASADFSSQGRNVLTGGECDRFLGVEVGLPHALEFGVDTCLTHQDSGEVWWNLKWQLPTADSDRFAVALGLQNVSHGDTAQPYLALAQAVGRGRGHLGVLRADGATHLMLGAEAPVSDTFDLVGDYLSGPGGSASVGCVWNPAPVWGLCVGRIWNRGATSERHWYFDVGYAFRAF